ncbi:MAG TPA: LysE family transporter [Methanoregulaceae archaeon]|nr:LysE family transporter [Methanoregulaceae archaeon]
MTSPLQMLLLGFLIGLTGALAPGPTLIATINASLKGGWTVGPRVTLGHAVVEMFMVVLIVMGLSVAIGEYSEIIAGIGGIALAAFGILTLQESRHASIEISDNTTVGGGRGPFFAGVLTSISNPYFWLWWFTVGSALLLGAITGGILSATFFILGHWAADLGWLTLVSASIHKGRFFLGERQYRVILGLCGIFLIFFGGYFISTIWLISW